MSFFRSLSLGWILLGSALVPALSSLTSNAHAQSETSLLNLPGFVELQSTPGWTENDTHIAHELLQKYISALHLSQNLSQHFSQLADCTFEFEKTIEKKLDAGRTMEHEQNKILELGKPAVLFELVRPWQNYPDISYKPTTPLKTEWKRFLNETLPEIESIAQKNYERIEEDPYSGRFIQRIEIVGYKNICEDIKNYLSEKYKVKKSSIHCGFKANPDQLKTISQSGHYLEMTKYTYPLSDGFQYRILKVKGCASEKIEKPETGKRKKHSDSEETGEENSEETVPEDFIEEDEKEVEESFEKNRSEKQKNSTRKKQTKTDQDQKQNKTKTSKKNAFYNQNKVHVSYDLPGTAASPLNPNSSTYLREYRKFHHRHSTKAEMDRDLEKINTLKNSLFETEKENFAKKEKLKLLRVELEPQRPFTKAVIPLDMAVSLDDLSQVYEMLIDRDEPWLVGCKVFNLIQQINYKTGTVKTEVICMIPNFRMIYHDPKRQGKIIYGPSFSVVDCSKGKSSIGCWDGSSSSRKKLKRSQVKRFQFRGKQKHEVTSLEGEKNKKYSKEFKVEGGIEGNIYDEVTGKPVQQAQIHFNHLDQQMSLTTDTQGHYVQDSFSLKLTKNPADIQHRLYEPKKFRAQTKVYAMATQEDIFLTPKKVTVTGKIDETFKPQYGSGLGGIKVSLPGYPSISGITEPDGSYILKEVPVTLDQIQFTDGQSGHQTATAAMALDIDQKNEQPTPLLIPNLTTLSGVVNASNGKPGRQLKVSIEGYPELSAVTDDNGRYQIKDIPKNLVGKNIIVAATEDGIYGEGSAPAVKIKPYQSNTQTTIVVPYFRSDVSGYVRDARSKEPIAGIQIRITDYPELTAVTDANGFYEIIRVPPAATQVLMSDPWGRYADEPRRISPALVRGYDTINQNFYAPLASFSRERIVVILNWNNQQADIDSQVFSPDGSHSYFKTLGDQAMSQRVGAMIDRDDTSTGGREIMYFKYKYGQMTQYGTYSLMAYQYVDNRITFRQGDVTAKIYKDGKYINTVESPEHLGRLWHIANIDGNGDIQLVNEFPSSEIQMQIQDLKISIEKYQAEKNGFASEIADVENDFPTLKGKIEAAQEEFDTIEQSIQKIIQDGETIQNDMNRIHQELATLKEKPTKEVSSPGLNPTDPPIVTQVPLTPAEIKSQKKTLHSQLDLHEKALIEYEKGLSQSQDSLKSVNKTRLEAQEKWQAAMADKPRLQEQIALRTQALDAAILAANQKIQQLDEALFNSLKRFR